LVITMSPIRDKIPESTSRDNSRSGPSMCESFE